MTLPTANLAYSRLTFGAMNRDASRPTAGNVGAWMAAQLNAPANDAANVQAALGAVRLAFTDKDASGNPLPTQYLPLTTLGESEANLWAAYKSVTASSPRIVRPTQEIQAASYIRAAQSPNQLFEMMVDFWHSHFNVNATSSQPAASSFPVLDQIIRANALGNFETMLVAVGQSVPMMYYLNQVESTGAHPNENYAREVMELHTLGAQRYLGLTTPTGQVGTGYSDQDVQQAAKILSGWTINSADGSFIFKANIHATGAKVFLGHTIPAGGQAEGQMMFDILARHAGTANTIATKLYRRFIGDVPPAQSAVITAMSHTFLANVGARNQIALVLSDLVQSQEFAASSGAKFKTPFEFIISLLRAINAPVNPTAQLNSELTAIGDPRYQWVPPNGRPDIAGPWMSNGSLLHRWNAAEDILSPGANIIAMGWNGLFDALRRDAPGGAVNLTNSGQAVTRAVANMLPGGVSSSTLAALNAYAAAPGVLGTASVFANETLLLTRLGMLIATVAATPEFQFRG